jgi:hypothetical protein
MTYAKKEFEIPVSFIIDETEKLVVEIKVFGGNEEKSIEYVMKIIKDYIEEDGINSDIAGLYNRLFKYIDKFFTFKARNKDILAGNNIHIQIMN